MIRLRFWQNMISPVFIIPALLVLGLHFGQAANVEHKDYYSDPVVRQAMSLAESTQTVDPNTGEQLFRSIDFDDASKRSPVPSEIHKDWNDLLYTAQILTYIKSATAHYFPVGFEIESTHATKRAHADFEEGSRHIAQLIGGHFGVHNIEFGIDPATDKKMLSMKDDAGRDWQVKIEWVREGEGPTPSGWETNSPPFFNIDDLEPFTAYLWRLSHSPFGQIADFCGVHQNFDVLPYGVQGDDQLRARVITNFLLLHEQFFPALLNLLKVERYGGFDNLFMRPYLYDHADFLQALMQMPPQQITAQKIQDLQRQFLREEFEAQIQNHVDDPEDRLEYESEWHQFRHNWKSRDVRIKWHENSRRWLLESRIMDHRPNEPWITMKGTLLMQLLLNKAYELALAQQTWQMNVPWRQDNESVADYYHRIEQHPGSSVDALFQALNVTDENLKKVILGQDIQTHREFQANDKISYGYETEFYTEKLVHFLVPNNPEWRAGWQVMNEQQKIDFLKSLGFEFDDEYSQKKYQVLTSMFRIDTDKYPHMDIRPHIEHSGRVEIISNGRDIYTAEQLKTAITQTHKVLMTDPEVRSGDSAISYHYHMFIPQNLIDRLTVQEKKNFVRYLDQLTLYMTLADYEELELFEPAHRADSWSLDRYSHQELQAVEDHLLGRRKIKNSDQKYHNIGFRPVIGGIDLEIRSIGEDVNYGIHIAELLQKALLEKKFALAPLATHQFMEPRHYTSGSEFKEFTLQEALRRAGLVTDSLGLKILRLLQFEIYKPSMDDFMYMPYGNAVDATLPEDLDVAHLRTNFESNIALPLMKWENEPYVTDAEKQLIRRERQNFLIKIAAVVKKVKQNPQYQFILNADNFYDLSTYLERSTHPTRPRAFKTGTAAEKQRELLEDLVYELRGYAVEFVKNTRVDKMVHRSLTAETPVTTNTTSTCRDLLQ